MRLIVPLALVTTALVACGEPVEDSMLELDTSSAEITAAGCTAGTVTACAAPLTTLVSRCTLAANTTFQVTTTQGTPATRPFECKLGAGIEQHCATTGNILKACTLTATNRFVTRRVGGSTSVAAVQCVGNRPIRLYADGYLNSCTILSDALNERRPPVGTAAGVPIACKAGTVLTLSSTGYATTCTPTTDQLTVRPPPYATNAYKTVNCSAAGAMNFYGAGAASGYLSSCTLVANTNIVTADPPFTRTTIPCKAGAAVSFGTNGRIKSCTLAARWTTDVLLDDMSGIAQRVCPANGVAGLASDLWSTDPDLYAERVRTIGGVSANTVCKLADHAACDAHAACDSGLCELNSGSPSCVPAGFRNGRSNGSTCLTNSNCLSGSCVDQGSGYSVCQGTASWGEACTINENCAVGHCGLRYPDDVGYQRCGDSNNGACWSDTGTYYGPAITCLSNFCAYNRCYDRTLSGHTGWGYTTRN